LETCHVKLFHCIGVFQRRYGERASGRLKNEKVIRKIIHLEEKAILIVKQDTKIVIEAGDEFCFEAKVPSLSTHGVVHDVSIRKAIATCTCFTPGTWICQHIRAVVLELGGYEKTQLHLDSFRASMCADNQIEDARLS
jgi:hypothetical protein